MQYRRRPALNAPSIVNRPVRLAIHLSEIEWRRNVPHISSPDRLEYKSQKLYERLREKTISNGDKNVSVGFSEPIPNLPVLHRFRRYM